MTSAMGLVTVLGHHSVVLRINVISVPQQTERIVRLCVSRLALRVMMGLMTHKMTFVMAPVDARVVPTSAHQTNVTLVQQRMGPIVRSFANPPVLDVMMAIRQRAPISVTAQVAASA
jgi:hypothetical protein